MKIVKPGWINHGGEPIYTIDIQRGDMRFTTGGQGGNGSGLVIIWSLNPLIDEKLENDEKTPKMLSRLENHSACVNCVRWSESGKFLATAGVDQITMIWQYAGRNQNSSSLGKPTNIEQWKCVHILRGHSGDILHLAWSSQDFFLASCSIDSSIIVWDAKHFPNKLASLEGHTRFVKGVTWDPVGKYLASQSDDKTLKIWSVSNWTCIKTIKKPFEECGGSTHFLRLDWSSDGASVVSSHAMDNGGPVAKIIARRHWTHENEFVGHRKAVTCVRFSSAIYECARKDGVNGKNAKCFTVCAMGSKDRSVSVWSTAHMRPVVVVYNIFSGNVMDLSWSTQSHLKFMACSSDGTVALIEFEQKELGQPLSLADKLSYLKELNGCNVSFGATNGHGAFDREVVDDPRLFKLQNESVSNQKPDHQQLKPPPSEGKENGEKNEKLPIPHQKQIEIRTKDGRRKIQPIFLGSSVVTEDPALKQADSPERNIASSATAPVLEDQIKVGQSAEPVEINYPNLIVAAATTPLRASTDSQVPAVAHASPEKPSAHASSSSIVSGSGSKVSEKPRKRKRRDHIILSDEEENDVCESYAPSQPIKIPSTSEAMPANQFLLPVPERRRDLLVTLETVGSSRGVATITVENDIYGDSGVNVCRLQCTQNKNVVWQTLLNSSAVLLSASNNVVSVATFDRNLIILSTTTGRHLTPRIALDTVATQLVSSNWYTLIITSKGSLYVWNLKDTVTLICKDSVSSIIHDGATRVSTAFMTDFGDPVVTLSDGRSYILSFKLSCWALVADVNDSLASLSSVKGVVRLESGSSTSSAGLLSSNLRLVTSNPASFIGKKSDSQALATLSYLESLMNSSLMVRSKSEYEFWLIQYAQELVRDESHFFKLKSLCQDLLDDCRRSTISCGIVQDVAATNKISLLNQILSLVARNPKLQRVYSEFREQLDALGHDDFI